MQIYFMQEYIDVIKKYAVISGRATRREYWMFVLYNALISIALCIITAIADATALMAVYYIFVLIPSICVSVRRLHDTGHSGWWLLISLVPLVGGIVLLVFYCLDSQKGGNQYGPNPKGIM